MIFEKLVLRNFGVYQGTHEIDLEPSSPQRPIILFGGLNGCGKTTILDAIQLALYGPHAHCSSRERMAYADFLADCTSRGVADGTKAGVELWLRTMESEGETHYRVERTWGVGTKVEETLVVRRDGRLDPLVTSRWNEHVEEMLPVSLAPLFFFDGEKIQSLADLDRSSSAIREALHALLGLGVVDQLVADLKVIERRHRSEVVGVENGEELESLEKERILMADRRAHLKQTLAGLQNSIDDCERAIESVENRLRNEGGRNFESRASLEQERECAGRRRSMLQEGLIGLAAGTAPLLLVTGHLKLLKGQAVSETRSTFLKSLRGELESRDLWILDQLLSLDPPQNLATRLGDLLRKDREERLVDANHPQVTGLSSNDLGLLAHLLDQELPEVAAAIVSTLAEMAEADEACTRADRLIEALPPEDKIRHLIDQRINQAAILDELREQAATLETELAQITRAEEAAENNLKRLGREILLANLVSTDSQRILTHSSRARETLDAFRGALVSRHLQQIEGLAFDSFSQLIRKKSMVARIAIDPETYRIQLFDRSNSTFPAKRLSAGERQLLAIGLLWGLARTSGRPVPIVIDTPLGRLDSSHRVNLVESYFPNVSHQVLLLSTDEEIDEKHLGRLRDHISHAYLLHHDDHNGGTTVDDGYFWEN